MARRAGAATGGPALEECVAFLRDPATYDPRPAEVEVIETHMSWVFLTDERVYKLKKPIRYDVLDFSTRRLRRRSCRREVRLNRRLAPNVYLGVVPLTLQPDGGLALGGPGTAVDWLVKMKRLPAERMLDRRIAAGGLRRREVVPAAARLASFYVDAIAAPVDGRGYREHLADGIRSDRRELVKRTYGLPVADVRRIAEEQLRYVEQARDLLDARVSTGRVVEGHGDLRPEHICLTEPPAIIDCLEFSRDLRILDPLDELSFLGLECARLGAAEVGGWFKEIYVEASGDCPPGHLLRFYRRFRALRRAKVAIWHVRDGRIDHPETWRQLAEWYIGSARDSGEA